MNHLDVVASTLVTDPVTAGLTVALGGDALEDVLNVGPGGLVTTGHEGGAVAGTLLTTRDTAADEVDALLLEVLGAAVAVGEVRVTTVNDDVALLQVGEKRLDEVIDGLAGHDKKHNATRTLQLGAELLNGVSTNDGLACKWNNSANPRRADTKSKRAVARNGDCLPLASLSRKRSTLEVVRL